MKYIRFEDGSINRDYEVGLLCPIHIVKESEKLEDLCDQFVMFDENNEFLIANNNFSVIKDIWQVALFRTAIDYKVDFFELVRCNTVEEYNRECPIAQISQFLFDALKKTMGDKKYVNKVNRG